MREKITIIGTSYADSFSGLGNSNFLYRFVNSQGLVTRFFCLLGDSYVNGRRVFQYVLPEKILEYQVAPASLKNLFVRQIEASKVKYVQAAVVTTEPAW